MSKWTSFKAWVIVPFLIHVGLSAMVSEPRKAAYQAKVAEKKGRRYLPYEPVKIPPEIEHEDDC